MLSLGLTVPAGVFYVQKVHAAFPGSHREKSPEDAWVVETIDMKVGGAFYRLHLQWTRCNRCKRCKSGGAHGPYWYAYREGDRGTPVYIGKDSSAMNVRRKVNARKKRG